jgi:hypothetical protein
VHLDGPDGLVPRADLFEGRIAGLGCGIQGSAAVGTPGAIYRQGSTLVRHHSSHFHRLWPAHTLADRNHVLGGEHALEGLLIQRQFGVLKAEAG